MQACTQPFIAKALVHHREPTLADFFSARSRIAGEKTATSNVTPRHRRHHSVDRIVDYGIGIVVARGRCDETLKGNTLRKATARRRRNHETCIAGPTAVETRLATVDPTVRAMPCAGITACRAATPAAVPARLFTIHHAVAAMTCARIHASNALIATVDPRLTAVHGAVATVAGTRYRVRTVTVAAVGSVTRITRRIAAVADRRHCSSQGTVRAGHRERHPQRKKGTSHRAYCLQTAECRSRG